MAQKKGFIYRMTMGRDDNPDFDVRRLPGTRFELFRDIFRNRFFVLVKINLLTLLFLLPAIAVVVLSLIMKTTLNGLIPYSQNFGFGYPVSPDAVELGAREFFRINMNMYYLLIPAALIASIGLAGAFHTMKLLVWGEGFSVTQAFFKGIKSNIVHFLWSTLIISLGVLVVGFNFSSVSLIGQTGIMPILALVTSVMLLVLLIFVANFIFTQCVTYKLKFWPLIKNSFLFAIGMIFQNVFFILILTGAPILLGMITSAITFIVIGLYVFFGISYTILVWTLYSQSVFDKFINVRVDGAVRGRGLYQMTAEEKAQARKDAEERRKKSATNKFVNPKRKKTVSVEEGSTFTPLEQSFSRADLQRLAEEKAKVKDEIEKTEFYQEGEAPENEDKTGD